MAVFTLLEEGSGQRKTTFIYT